MKSNEQLVDEFSVAAQRWGWQSDQGFGKAVDESEKQYKETKARLLRRIRKLELLIKYSKGLG